LLVPLSDAVTVTVVLLVTAEVEMVKLTCVWPAGTVTELPRLILLLLSVNETVVPLAGAGPESMTVPVTFVPPLTDDG
jgi:hypothetical protein